jgi:hypothetical protein
MKKKMNLLIAVESFTKTQLNVLIYTFRFFFVSKVFIGHVNSLVILVSQVSTKSSLHLMLKKKKKKKKKNKTKSNNL